MIFAIIFMLLQVADWWTTKRFLASGVDEFFPQIRWVIKHFGMAGLLIYKLVYGAILVAIFLPEPMYLAAFCGLYIGVVMWNFERGSKK